MRAWRTLGRLLLILAAWQAAIRLARRFVDFPAPAFIGRFLASDARRRMQPAETIVRRSGAAAGMAVLEIGCGSGAYTPDVAAAIGPHGRVYALDVQAGMLRQLRARLAQRTGPDHAPVTPIQGSAYALPLADGSLDLVYLITVLQEIPDPVRALREIGRVLRPGGSVAITEWIADPDYPWAATTIRQGLAAGLQVAAVEGNLWSYTVRFQRS